MNLSAEEKGAIGEQLEELRTDLTERITQLEESSKPVSLDDPIGRLSRMDAIQGQQMALAGLTRLRQRLERVRQALREIDEEGFGACEACGEPIGFDRLEFEPESTRCVRCADRS